MFLETIPFVVFLLIKDFNGRKILKNWNFSIGNAPILIEIKKMGYNYRYPNRLVTIIM